MMRRCNFLAVYVPWRCRSTRSQNDIRLMSCILRAGFAELLIPEKRTQLLDYARQSEPTQAEALTMIAVQVMANDVLPQNSVVQQFSVDHCSVDCVSYSHIDGDIVLGKQVRTR